MPENESVLEALYLEVRAHLLRTAQRLLGDRAAAEDVVQETWVRALRSYPGTADGLPSRAWLYRVTVNLCYDRFRSASRREIPSEPDRLTEAGATQPVASGRAMGVSPSEEAVLRAETAAAIRQAVSGLPPALREAITLREMAGLRYLEIAQVTGCPVGTVMSRLHLARRRLRAALAPYLELDDPGGTKP